MYQLSTITSSPSIHLPLRLRVPGTRLEIKLASLDLSSSSTAGGRIRTVVSTSQQPGHEITPGSIPGFCNHQQPTNAQKPTSKTSLSYLMQNFLYYLFYSLCPVPLCLDIFQQPTTHESNSTTVKTRRRCNSTYLSYQLPNMVLMNESLLLILILQL